jgi:AcrR family transcriptional regulator
MPPSATTRRRDPAARRQAILEAGLAEFVANGFAAAKLDDVAARAGVGKGTIYLYFKDKQDLFEQIVRAAVTPVIARLEEATALPDVPADALLRTLFDLFRTEILATSRRHVLRLIITEGTRFPAIAEFYHREVLSRALGLLRSALARAEAKQELSVDGLARFPQLVFAPLLVSVIWDGLFGDIDPLDVEPMLDVHHALLVRDKPVAGPQ